jgi:DNA-binding phage protein
MPSREERGSVEVAAAGLGTPCGRARIAPVEADRAHAALAATFATNGRERADEMGITLSDVAQRAGVPREELQALLGGGQEPTLRTLVKVGAAVGSGIVELLIEAPMSKRRKR